MFWLKQNSIFDCNVFFFLHLDENVKLLFSFYVTPLLLLIAIVKFTQLCSKFPPTALSNFACDWLALDRDISFGRLTSPNV